MEAKPMEHLKQICKEVADVEPGKSNVLVSHLNSMTIAYYEEVRNQAQKSFWGAFVTAMVGFVFLGCGLYAEMMGLTKTFLNASLISASLVEFIAGVVFYLYLKVARQFASFHICLERTNRYTLANSLCDNLTCHVRRDEVRSELIRIIANAPMLTLNEVEGQASMKMPEVSVEDHKVNDSNNGRVLNGSMASN